MIFLLKILSAIIICSVLITGCWDRRELNEIGIVVAIALDKDESGNIVMTSQVVRPGALKREGGGPPSLPIELVTAQGSTVAEAVKNISKQFDRIAFFAHTKVLVVSEEVARQGLQPILDYQMRNNNTRNLVWLIVAKDSPAKEFVRTDYGIESVQATYLEDIIKNKGENSEVSTVDLLTYLKAMTSGADPVAGVMEIVRQSTIPTKEKAEGFTKGIKLVGTAVFKKDKLVGFLNHTETRGLNFVRGKIKKTIINIPSLKEENGLVAIAITKIKSRVIPTISEGKPSFVIDVHVDGDIAEQQDTADYFGDLKTFAELELELQSAIENEINTTVNKTQKTFGSDILGFGTALAKTYPNEWEKEKDKWGDDFSTADYQVKVDVKLRNLGLILKPIHPPQE